MLLQNKKNHIKNLPTHCSKMKNNVCAEAMLPESCYTTSTLQTAVKNIPMEITNANRNYIQDYENFSKRINV